jgi:hypothetical protein
MFFELSDFTHDPETHGVVVRNQYGDLISEETWPPSSNIKPTRKPLQISKVHLHVSIMERAPDTSSTDPVVSGNVEEEGALVNWAPTSDYFPLGLLRYRPGIVTATVVVYPSEDMPLDITLATGDDVRIISATTIMHHFDLQRTSCHESQWYLENDEDYVFVLSEHEKVSIPDDCAATVPPVYHEFQIVFEQARIDVIPCRAAELTLTITIHKLQETLQGLFEILGFPSHEVAVIEYHPCAALELG